METALAYLISIGITACGIWIVVGTLAAGSALAWTLCGSSYCYDRIFQPF
jgi:hypothetical protein